MGMDIMVNAVVDAIVDVVVDALTEDALADVVSNVEGADTVTRTETVLIVAQSVKPSAQTTILQPYF